ncbi:MAG: fluoride efflux transporter CrcB [Actinomycetota bacterium]
MTTALLVALGAAAGAGARWAVDQAVRRRVGGAFPWGTFVVNVSGSLLLGGLLAAATLGSATVATVALVGTGFAGAFTTFSTFAYETVRLLEERAHTTALVNVAGSLAAGTAAVVTGWLVVGTLLA